MSARVCVGMKGQPESEGKLNKIIREKTHEPEKEPEEGKAC